MDKTGIAEWMLSRRFGIERASEIAGDLLEQHTPARARVQMLRLAFAIPLSELAMLAFLSLLFLIAQRALFSPWQLRFITTIRDQHIGWPWYMFVQLANLALILWLITASSALRAGFDSRFTRSALLLSLALSIVSAFMWHDDLRHISPVVIGLVILWAFRSYGTAATLAPILAAVAWIGSVSFLLHFGSGSLSDLHSCVVTVHDQRPQPLWFSFAGGCTSLTFHEWARFALSLLLTSWLILFLPGGTPRRRRFA